MPPGRFLSTLPARGATYPSRLHPPEAPISIHAPREGSDALPETCTLSWAYFYPRSPRGERPKNANILLLLQNFYPRSPRGERPAAAADGGDHLIISIHAPREGSDLTAGVCDGGQVPFLSTLPARGATDVGHRLTAHDTLFLSTLPARGATQATSDASTSASPFLSTLPARGATLQRRKISEDAQHFYPRSPRGERRKQAPAGHPVRDISIHAPREGSDLWQTGLQTNRKNFYPRSPRGERHGPL